MLQHGTLLFRILSISVILSCFFIAQVSISVPNSLWLLNRVSHIWALLDSLPVSLLIFSYLLAVYTSKSFGNSFWYFLCSVPWVVYFGCVSTSSHFRARLIKEVIEPKYFQAVPDKRGVYVWWSYIWLGQMQQCWIKGRKQGHLEISAMNLLHVGHWSYNLWHGPSRWR